MEKMTIISHEHKCSECKYGRWAPKEYQKCYICQNVDAHWFGRKVNGFELLTCKAFDKKDNENDW